MSPYWLMLCSMAMVIALGAASARGQELSPQDKEFVKASGSGGMLEVRLGQYASDNAGSDDVKKFGEHMVGDHTKTNMELHTVATQVPIEIPYSLSEDDQKVLDRLEKLKGTEFDEAYVAQMIEDHEKDVAAFQKEVSDGSLIAVKAFAEKTLPILKHHLEMAKELQKKMGL